MVRNLAHVNQTNTWYNIGAMCKRQCTLGVENNHLLPRQQSSNMLSHTKYWSYIFADHRDSGIMPATYNVFYFDFIRLLWTYGLKTQGLYSRSRRTSYYKVSWNHEATRMDVVSLWNLVCVSVALLSRCLPNIRAIRRVLCRISLVRDFGRSYGKTSVHSANRGPVLCMNHVLLIRKR